MTPINREGTSYPSTGVLVFSKETGCTQCVLTKRILLEEGIDHTIIYIDRPENQADRDWIVEVTGKTQAPIVVTDTTWWSGFQPHKIKEINNV